MAGFVKNREKTELLAGLITMGAAILLLIFAVLFMTRCTADTPDDTQATESTAMSTNATESTLPPLATNPYGPGDFAYDNGYLTCLAGESMLGVDVSYHQGDIDWAKVARTDVRFAMVRIGRRFIDSGTIEADPMWQVNLQGAKENGLLVGVYFFSQAINPAEALEEAEFVLELLDGMPLDLPVVFDWEPMGEDDRTSHMDAETLNACAKIFCDAIAEAGYTPMVYFNEDLSSRLLDLQQMQQEGYAFWLAKYSNQMTFPHKIDMWQYTDGGNVPGIEGNVDLNLYFTYK